MVALKEFRLKRSISEPRGKALLHICWIRVLCSSFLLLLIVGCSSYGVIHNEPGVDVNAGQPYSLTTWAQSEEAADFVFIVAFSGGGTRAAAMAYGVLEELRDTNIVIEGRESRLLDEVTHISSVSGGSFTSAYYGLYGDRIFNDFEASILPAYPPILEARDFLRRQGASVALLSGSGSAVFGFFNDEESALAASRAKAREGWRVFPAKTLSRTEYFQSMFG